MSRLTVEQLVLRGIGPVDLTVEGSECVTISGPSGAGKTLVLRAIADMEEHDGRVYLDLKECRDISAPEWRRNVGMLPAESQWWHDTVGSHFPDPNREDVGQLGFDASVMGWSVSRLSSGERQRLALLRLLCNRPRALLLDEPTANLDPASLRLVEELLGRYQRRHSAPLLWVTHDARQIQRVSSRHYTLEAGRLRLN